jgi:predicted Zn-dependent peptidase
MKIKNNILVIELTSDELNRDLRSYQADMLAELIHCELGPRVDRDLYAEAQFMLKLLQEGESSDWFQDLIEKHGIRWISLYNGSVKYSHSKLVLIQIAQEYPGIFEFVEVLENNNDNNFNENSFEIYVDGKKLNSAIIWKNI